MARKPNEHLSIYLLKLAGIGSLFVLISILSPQFPYVVIKALLKRKFGSNYSNRQIGSSIRYLKRKKFIAYENRQGKMRIVLTKLGKQHLKSVDLDLIQIKPHAWDGKWHVLMFDIPEQHKAARSAFRRLLKQLGFVHFQRSVFLLPFRCEEEITKITEQFSIRPYVHVLTAGRFPNDKTLLKKFGIYPM